MTLSLDTNVLIEVLRNRNPAARRAFGAALAGSEPVVASIIVHHELLFGAALHPNPVAERQNVRRLMELIAVEPLDGRDVSVAADIRAELRRRGVSIGPFDLLIAGQALARGWTVVTNNLREFNRVADLKVVDWTARST